MLVACLGILEKEGGMNFFLNFILPTSAISSSAFWKLNGNINRHEIYHGSANFYLLPTSLDTKLFASNLDQHIGFLNISWKYFL